jgi:hypothetical protein
MTEGDIETTVSAGATFRIFGVLRRQCDVEGCNNRGSVEILAKWDEAPESARCLCRDHLALLEAYMVRKGQGE